MWSKVKKKFRDYPAREAVARKMVELGLRISVEGGRKKIFCGDVEVKDVSLAKAAGVDRRAVRTTVEAIERDAELKNVFEKIWPSGALLKNVARELGYGVIEIEADAQKSGIIAGATTLLASKRVSIRQAHADDPGLAERPKLTLITERRVPGSLVNEFLKIRGVTRVSVS
jgi:predicted regulator of amino acid metabolism with ACT domain